MARSEPTLTVTCNGCGVRVRCEMTQLGSNDWASDTVSAELKAAGWTRSGNRDYCPECSKEKANAK